MERETCVNCEKKVLDAAIDVGDLDLFLDRDIWQIDNSVCIKCLIRIATRYIDNENKWN